MTNKEWNKAGIKDNSYVSVTFTVKGKTVTEGNIKFRSCINGKCTFLTENWAGDFYYIHIKEIDSIKPYKP